MTEITAFRTALEPGLRETAQDLGVAPILSTNQVIPTEESPLMESLGLSGLTDLADTEDKVRIVEAFFTKQLKASGAEVTPEALRQALESLDSEIKFSRPGAGLSRLNRLIAYVKTMVRVEKEHAKLAKDLGVEPRKPQLAKDATREELGRILFS